MRNFLLYELSFQLSIHIEFTVSAQHVRVAMWDRLNCEHQSVSSIYISRERERERERFRPPLFAMFSFVRWRFTWHQFTFHHCCKLSTPHEYSHYCNNGEMLIGTSTELTAYLERDYYSPQLIVLYRKL